MKYSVGVAILAAGKGTRLKIEKPKVLCPLLGQTLLDYVLDSAQLFFSTQNLTPHYNVIVGYKKDEVEAHLSHNYGGRIHTSYQKEQKGTADAVRTYFESKEFAKHDLTFICCGDTPLIDASIFNQMYEHFLKKPKSNGVAASFKLDNPFGYGRIVRSKRGFKIVEEKEVTSKEKKIQELNAGFYLLKTKFLLEALKKVNNKNNSHEYYLTDIFKEGSGVEACCFENPNPFLGVNTLVQLQEVREILKKNKINQLLSDGVLILDSASTHIDWKVNVESETVISPGVHLQGTTQIGSNVLIEPGVIIKNSKIERDAQILAYSYLDTSYVKKGAQVGPFARLRPETELGENTKVGNFVEIKKSKLAPGSKVSHLSYVGDAEIGANSNIGCGFITCNYDGVKKHQTKIGSNVFIGSDVQVVAPIEVGNNAFVAAGSTLTKDVPEDGFAIARSPQVTKEGLAHKFLKKK